MSHFARGTVLCEKLKALIRNYCTSIKWRKKTYMYPAIFKSGSLLGQSKNEQPHVILFPSSQAEAEAPLAAFQLHHKAALLFTRKIVTDRLKQLMQNHSWGGNESGKSITWLIYITIKSFWGSIDTRAE